LFLRCDGAEAANTKVRLAKRTEWPPVTSGAHQVYVPAATMFVRLHWNKKHFPLTASFDRPILRSFTVDGVAGLAQIDEESWDSFESIELRLYHGEW